MTQTSRDAREKEGKEREKVATEKSLRGPHAEEKVENAKGRKQTFVRRSDV
jgi:hypothetical protein